MTELWLCELMMPPDAPMPPLLPTASATDDAGFQAKRSADRQKGSTLDFTSTKLKHTEVFMISHYKTSIDLEKRSPHRLRHHP